jgi:hypothetical protein
MYLLLILFLSDSSRFEALNGKISPTAGARRTKILLPEAEHAKKSETESG